MYGSTTEGDVAERFISIISVLHIVVIIYLQRPLVIPWMTCLSRHFPLYSNTPHHYLYKDHLSTETTCLQRPPFSGHLPSLYGQVPLCLCTVCICVCCNVSTINLFLWNFQGFPGLNGSPGLVGIPGHKVSYLVQFYVLVVVVVVFVFL